ncbi:glutathione S-transferase family protein [Phenylobacterium sp.]|uniref:glutathione S-transferase family protein n=1 Tax=Phenylobacterium sp. TaxID=1871053 RepID=UPI0025F01194|nr:glutathione S-transferase family protein [Phenylobacterium sp.]
MTGYVVWGAKGSGSVAVEAALTLMGQRYEVREHPAWEGGAEADAVAAVNPQRQIPALELPGGQVMTESAAILIHLTERHPEAGLAPAPGDPERAAFLRWMIYIPAQIYSMYWVRDVPSRLAADAAAEAVILARTAQRVADCWAMMEAQLSPGRHLLGDRLSVLDVYVAVVSRWTPGRSRFNAVAPRTAEAIRRVDADPRLAALWAERMPFPADWQG